MDRKKPETTKTRKCQQKKNNVKKKLKKSKDRSRCCNACNFCDKRNKEDPICTITGESTTLDGICQKINTEIVSKCQCCGKELRYKTKEDYYRNCFLFELKTEGGDSSGQRIHLCGSCREMAYETFQDILDKFLGHK